METKPTSKSLHDEGYARLRGIHISDRLWDHAKKQPLGASEYIRKLIQTDIFENGERVRLAAPDKAHAGQTWVKENLLGVYVPSNEVYSALQSLGMGKRTAFTSLKLAGAIPVRKGKIWYLTVPEP